MKQSKRELIDRAGVRGSRKRASQPCWMGFSFLNEGTKWENGGGELLEHEGEKKMAGW